MNAIKQKTNMTPSPKIDKLQKELCKMLTQMRYVNEPRECIIRIHADDLKAVNKFLKRAVKKSGSPTPAHFLNTENADGGAMLFHAAAGNIAPPAAAVAPRQRQRHQPTQ